MPLPAIVGSVVAPLAVNAAASWLGSRILGNGPDVPDLSAGVSDAFDLAEGRLSNQYQRALDSIFGRLDERTGDLREDLAAMGVTGSGGMAQMEALFRSGNEILRDLSSGYGDAFAGLGADEAAAINAAEQQEALMKYARDSQRKARQYQALGGLIGAGNQFYNMHRLNQMNNPITGDFSPEKFESLGLDASVLGRLPVPYRPSAELPLATFNL